MLTAGYLDTKPCQPYSRKKADPKYNFTFGRLFFTELLEFFLNGAELVLNPVIAENSGNLINHYSIN